MNGAVRTSLLLILIVAASCAVDPRDASQGDLSSESQSLTAATEFGGLTYGAAGVVRSRGGGTVKTCIAGPMGVLLPNRFVSCYCDQLVKDCEQDTTCTTCSNVRYEQCKQTSWFSSVSYLFGDCNVSELNDCMAYCQQNCSPSCAME